MTVQELCEKIELQDCMKKGVCEFVSSYDFTQVEDILDGLTHADKAEAAYEKLMNVFEEDEAKIKVLTCFLISACRTYENYHQKGISEKIFVDTMKCFTRYTQECKVRRGYYEFDRAFWTYRQSSMVLFRLGQLEFEMKKNEEGKKVVAVHIPSDSKITPENVDAALKMAEEFFGTYYPDYADCEYTCYSWLLAPKLKDLLGEDSNIIRFQNRFDIRMEDKECLDILEWLFKVLEDADYATLPEDTSLQRKAKDLLLQGDNVGIGSGVLKKGKEE